MKYERLMRVATLAIAIGALSAPLAIARPGGPPPSAADAGQARQDKRSPDAIDAATRIAPRQDKRSPDARDAAEGRGPSTSPEVVVVKLSEAAPADAFDWADAAVGAGVLLGVTVLGLGAALVAVHRRTGRRAAASDVSGDARSSGTAGATTAAPAGRSIATGRTVAHDPVEDGVQQVAQPLGG
jgi:hypothetical protein